MKQILKSLYIFVRLTIAGFYFSDNTDHFQKNYSGFYRLNYVRDETAVYGLFDVDFHESPTSFHYHFHGGVDNTTIFRVDSRRNTQCSRS